MSIPNNPDGVYVPAPELTVGQTPPIAANDGLSYMSFSKMATQALLLQ